jgi:hypothetical protein
MAGGGGEWLICRWGGGSRINVMVEEGGGGQKTAMYVLYYSSLFSMSKVKMT